MRSGVERGAERNVHERDTQSCGELFFGPVSVNYEKFQKKLTNICANTDYSDKNHSRDHNYSNRLNKRAKN